MCACGGIEACTGMDASIRTVEEQRCLVFTPSTYPKKGLSDERDGNRAKSMLFVCSTTYRTRYFYPLFKPLCVCVCVRIKMRLCVCVGCNTKNRGKTIVDLVCDAWAFQFLVLLWMRGMLALNRKYDLFYYYLCANSSSAGFFRCWFARSLASHSFIHIRDDIYRNRTCYSHIWVVYIVQMV